MHITNTSLAEINYEKKQILAGFGWQLKEINPVIK